MQIQRLMAGSALALGACGSSSKDKSTTSAAQTPATTATAPTSTQPATGSNGCKKVAAQAAIKRTAKKPATTLSSSKKHVVTLQTSCGTIKITLDVKHDPTTASSFAKLASSGFYDGLSFVRVVPGFVIQGGDPNGDGSGGPGYSIVEAPPSSQTYTKGIVAMAKTAAEAPGTSGSQFFIVTGADAGLPAEYAVAGKVTSGMAVADKIGAIPPTNGQDGPPSQPVSIEKASVSSK